MEKEMLAMYDLVQELAWHFGSRGFAGECCGDLTLVEFIALKRLQAVDNATIQELGNALGFTKGGSSKLIDRLEKKGYVLRQSSPVDGRVCCVSATVKGKETVRKISENYTTYLEDALIGVGAEQVERIADSLKVLVNRVRNKPFICG